MDNYELVIKYDNKKRLRYFLIAFILFNAIFMAALNLDPFPLKFPFTAIFIIVLLIADLVRKKAGLRFNTLPVCIAILIFSYLKLGLWWYALLVLVVGLLYIVSAGEKIIRVNDNHISYPSFPKKIINWPSLSNMLLKDGLLTMDFKNNKIVQHEVTNGAYDADLDEKNFNEFCQQQLKNKT